MRGLIAGAICLLFSFEPLAGQDPLAPHDSVTLNAVLSFADYDRDVPLHVEIASTDRPLGFQRDKFIFTGGWRSRVPGFLSLPSGPGPHPVVLLLHAGAGSKDVWWAADGFERGASLTRNLLDAGFAVVALDAENAGERTSGAGFVPITTWYFEREWWSTFRTGVVETVTDYRRALDYLSTRPEIDTSSVAVVGVSMGAIVGAYLAAADPRIHSLVSASGALTPDWLFPMTHPNLSPALRDRRVLSLVGTDDNLVEVESAEAFHDLLRAPDEELVVYEGGHRPPADWTAIAFDWISNDSRSAR